MSMQMQRVGVVALVPKYHAISFPSLNHQWIGMRIRLPVDSPTVEAAVTTRNLLEYQIELPFRCDHMVCLLPKERVVPILLFWFCPLRGTLLIGVLNDHTETVLAIIIVRRPQNPDTRRVHAHDGIDTLCRADLKHFHLLRLRYRVAIECDDFEFVGGESHVHGFRCA